MMFLKDYLQYEKPKKRRTSREAEKQISKEAGKREKQRSWKSRKAGKAERQRSREAKKQRNG